MSKLLVIGASEELTRHLRAGHRTRLTVRREEWLSMKRHPATLLDADVLLVDMTSPNAYSARGLANLQNAYPRRPLVIRTDADLSHSNALTRLLEKPTVDFVRSSANADEVIQRIRRLLNLRQNADPFAPGAPSSPITRILVTEIHDPKSGRLDARRIADYFAIPLADVARALGVSLSRLHKTPSATSAQVGLFLYERIAYALQILAGSKENSRVWLNLPEAQLEGKTPISLLKEGRGDIVAEMLDDMLLGQPS